MFSTPACDCLREDHRIMEGHLDRFLAALLHLTAERVPEVQAGFRDIQQLASVHFEKEENIFYPAIRKRYPGLLARMDEQHGTVREVEEHVAGMLSDAPPEPDSRWLNELQLFGIEFHDHIQHHIVDEEEQLFRVAAGCLLREDQVRLAKEMRELQAKRSAA